MTPKTPATRHLTATVAQYIHELSERHAKDREAVTVAVIPIVAEPRTA
jgi:hypothetical protein